MAVQPIHEFLEKFPSDIQDICQLLSGLIKENLSGVIERVYLGWQLIGYRIKVGNRSRYFAFIAPFFDHVRLGFEYGAFLSDPCKLLMGNGSQVRYVYIKKWEDMDKSQLAILITEGAQIATLPKHEIFLSKDV